MDNNELKFRLVESLEKIYYMEAFTHMTEFLQGELYLLKFLVSNKDKEFGPSELSKKINISRPRITTTISALKKKNLVITKPDKDDRRRLKIKATTKGEKLILNKEKDVLKNFDAFIDGIGAKDTLELIRIIDLAADIMSDESYKKDNNRGCKQ